MRNSPPIYFCALLFCLLISPIANGQLNKKHSTLTLTYLKLGNGVKSNQSIYILSPIGKPVISISAGTITKTTPKKVFIGYEARFFLEPTSETILIINDRGYETKAEDVMYVSNRMRGRDDAITGSLVSYNKVGNFGL